MLVSFNLTVNMMFPLTIVVLIFSAASTIDAQNDSATSSDQIMDLVADRLRSLKESHPNVAFKNDDQLQKYILQTVDTTFAIGCDTYDRYIAGKHENSKRIYSYTAQYRFVNEILFIKNLKPIETFV